MEPERPGRVELHRFPSGHLHQEAMSDLIGIAQRLAARDVKGRFAARIDLEADDARLLCREVNGIALFEHLPLGQVEQAKHLSIPFVERG